MKKIMIAVLMVLVIGVAVYKLLPNKIRQEAPGKNEMIERDEFSILMPSGWREVDPLAEGIMMSAIDNKKSEDGMAKEKNFYTNYNVAFAKLEDITIEEYVKYLQGEIKKMMTEVKIGNEQKNGFEAEINQEGINFKAKVAVFPGKEGDVWTISFNTTKNEWPKYSIIFEEIIKNFLVKDNNKQI
jgi:hypothetical protein